MRGYRLRVFALVVFVAGPPLLAQAPEDAAQAAAESWVKIVDAGNYGSSWDEAAAMFKGAVTKEQWNEAVTRARGPLGGVSSRTLESKQVTEQLPGAPAGKYVVIRFTTAFENAPKVVEMVVLMLAPDGAWKVAGYTVRPG